MTDTASLTSIPKTTPREDRTRCDILAATRSLVERFGFAKITLDDIAKCLGKKKSFLYYYYSDKESILVAAVRREIEAIHEEIQTAVARESTGKAKISAYLLQYHREIKRRLPMITHLRREVESGSAKSYAMILEQSRRTRQAEIPVVADLLRLGVKDGSLRNMADREILAMAGFLLMALRGIEQEYILGEAGEATEASFEIAIRTLERGLAP